MGDEKVLLDYQIDALHAADLEDIVVVIGYQGEQIHARYGSSLRYVENPDYLTTNSIYSLYLACQELDTETFLLNCDILFHPEVLRRMLDSGYPNVVAVDSQADRIADEMNVVFNHRQQISAISKDLDPDHAQAQSMQLAKFDAAGAHQLRREVEKLIERQRKDVFPTSAYAPLVETGLLYAVEAGYLPWTEIDSLEDYDYATRRVLPLIANP